MNEVFFKSHNMLHLVSNYYRDMDANKFGMQLKVLRFNFSSATDQKTNIHLNKYIK